MTSLQRKSGAFTGQRSWKGTPSHLERHTYLTFLKRFLQWKQRKPFHRDCLLLTTLDVEAAKCVTFTWIQPPAAQIPGLDAQKPGLASKKSGLAAQGPGLAETPLPVSPFSPISPNVTIRQILLPFELGRSVESYRARDSTRYAFPPGGCVVIGDQAY